MNDTESAPSIEADSIEAPASIEADPSEAPTTDADPIEAGSIEADSIEADSIEADSIERARPPVRPSDVGWGSYKNREGPYYPGRVRLAPIADPSPLQKFLLVLAATESQGGKPGAVNMYDPGDISLGLVQFAESAGGQAVGLLGHLKEHHPDAMEPLELFAAGLDAELVQLGGVWRMVAGGVPVLTPRQRQELYYGGARGTVGSWTTKAQRERAKAWAAAFATVLEDERTHATHAEYAARRLLGYVMPASAPLVFPGGQIAESGWLGAMQAIFVSFAANRPATADQHLRAFVAQHGEPGEAPSGEYVTALAAELTLGPGIGIYPQRYNDLRPAVERLYGVDLPDLAGQLPAPGPPGVPDLYTVRGLQLALLQLGADLGPAGANGIEDPKTRAAIERFQKSRGLVVDGKVGPKTRAALAAALAKLAGKA